VKCFVLKPSITYKFPSVWSDYCYILHNVIHLHTKTSVTCCCHFWFCYFNYFIIHKKWNVGSSLSI